MRTAAQITDGLPTASASLAPPRKQPVDASGSHGRNDASPAALTRARALRDGNARSSRPPRQHFSTSPPYTDDGMIARRILAGDNGGAVSSLDRPTRLCPSCTGTKHILLSLLAVHTARPRHLPTHRVTAPSVPIAPLAPSPRPSLRPAQSLPDEMKKHQG